MDDDALQVSLRCLLGFCGEQPRDISHERPLLVLFKSDPSFDANRKLEERGTQKEVT